MCPHDNDLKGKTTYEQCMSNRVHSQHLNAHSFYKLAKFYVKILHVLNVNVTKNTCAEQCYILVYFIALKSFHTLNVRCFSSL